MHALGTGGRKAVALIVFFALMIGAASIMARPQTLVRDSIPDKYKWDFTHIYPDWDAWKADMTKLETMMDQYAALQGTLAQGPDQLVKSFQLDDDLGMLLYRVYRYPQLQRDVDTRKQEVSAHLQEIQILYAKFQTKTAWFRPELLAISWDTMKGWLDRTPELAPYRFNIEDLYRQQAHVFSEDKETMLSYFNQFNGTPSSVYDELSTSDIKFRDVVFSNGDTIKLTPGAYYNTLSTNRNQDDRRTAFEGFYSVFNDNVNTYAAIYNAILQRDWAQAQARKYNSTLNAALDGDNVPEQVFEQLVTTVRGGTAPVQRYITLRKEALGLDSYHLYDGSIPAIDFDKDYEYDDVVEPIIASVAPLGKEYQGKMREIFESRWIDVYENEGKSSGAYSANVYGVHPYLLLNYNNTLENVFTVAHEVGHCMHTRLSSENQPFATSSYTIFVAEVASTMNEALFLDYTLKQTKDPKERLALLQHAIDGIVGTFYTQVMFADFEWQAHKLAEEGQPVTADALRGLYQGLLTEYYGDAVAKDSLYGSTWTRISHFYNSPYYVYKYATCFASSAQLVKGITGGDKKARQEVLEKYLTLLKSGGNDYPMDQLKKAGVDLSQQATIQAVVDQLDVLVNQFEQELKKI